MSVSEPGDVTEVCDWCGQAVYQESARYERMPDPDSEQDVVLTACSDDHLRWLRDRYGS